MYSISQQVSMQVFVQLVYYILMVNLWPVVYYILILICLYISLHISSTREEVLVIDEYKTKLLYLLILCYKLEMLQLQDKSANS